MRKRYYIIFVAREEDGRLRKIPVPLHYAYVFVAAAVVGAFTLTGMAGSYSRMLLKTASFNQIRSQHEALRKDYKQLEHVAEEKEVQAASLGSLASEVSALYGLKQNQMAKSAGTAKSSPAAVGSVDNPGATFTDAAYTESFDQLSSLRATALSGRLSRAFGEGLTPSSGDSWLNMADAPALWPVAGPITSSFGERSDPFSGEGAFHKGIDISASYGQPVRATADGVVLTAAMGNGYGREILVDHGHGIETLYGHLSGFAVTSGEQVRIGQIIGYVGTSGRSTGPHLHYEVRIRDTPVNPYKYLRQTMDQLTASIGDSSKLAGN
ncbi:M23 family metallopeptidase [Silvibacterium acidisoli]|uniref:M23 family metallopeptidase n=1 Tax=Acidobacteriaceae bacterium ZG23-2 TaxID=2883246 RepID=UPI00406CBC84